VRVACTAVAALWPRPPRPSKRASNVAHGFFVVEHDDLLQPFCHLTLFSSQNLRKSPQVFVRTYEKYDSPTRAVVLGKLQCNRWMAASRQKLWWMVPSWGDSASQIPEETQFLLIRMSQEDACKGTTPEEETYALIVPMVSGPYRSSIRVGRTDKRNLVLTVESGDEDVDCNQDLDLCFISAGMPHPNVSSGVSRRMPPQPPPETNFAYVCVRILQPSRFFCIQNNVQRATRGKKFRAPSQDRMGE
jgi:hypothetical protein